jgi:hypothetical protein
MRSSSRLCSGPLAVPIKPPTLRGRATNSLPQSGPFAALSSRRDVKQSPSCEAAAKKPSPCNRSLCLCRNPQSREHRAIIMIPTGLFSVCLCRSLRKLKRRTRVMIWGEHVMYRWGVNLAHNDQTTEHYEERGNCDEKPTQAQAQPPVEKYLHLGTHPVHAEPVTFLLSTI